MGLITLVRTGALLRGTRARAGAGADLPDRTRPSQRRQRVRVRAVATTRAVPRRGRGGIEPISDGGFSGRLHSSARVAIIRLAARSRYIRRHRVNWEPTDLHRRRLWRPPWRTMTQFSILQGLYEPYLIWSNKGNKWGALYNRRSGRPFHKGYPSATDHLGYGTPVG